ncbi:hypothetical protein AAG906_038426 [Vitis piasezkii]
MGLWPRTHQFLPQPLLLMMLMLILLSAPLINATSTSSEKHDQILVPQVPDSSIKCMTCPCVNPCSDQHSPPPPPPPSPPPPPPPPRTQDCGQQVPPPPRFIYITEPPPPRFTYIISEPGNLYATNPSNLGFYSASGRNVVIGFMVLVGCGILEVLIMEY